MTIAPTNNYYVIAYGLVEILPVQIERPEGHHGKDLDLAEFDRRAA